MTPTEGAYTLLELVGYIIICARNLLDETPDYGPVRLLEVADRLLSSCESLDGLDQPLWARDLQARVKTGGRALTDGPEAFQSFLDDLVASIMNSLIGPRACTRETPTSQREAQRDD
jgi:hypothetical protein